MLFGLNWVPIGASLMKNMLFPTSFSGARVEIISDPREFASEASESEAWYTKSARETSVLKKSMTAFLSTRKKCWFIDE